MLLRIRHRASPHERAPGAASINAEVIGGNLEAISTHGGLVAKGVGSKQPEVVKRVRRPTAARRQELLEVAASLFASRGYYSVTVDDIGEALGITGPAIYKHFPSKEALLVGVFDGVIAHQTERMQVVMSEASTSAEALPAMIRLHLDFAINQRENLSVWRQEFHNLPEDDRWRLRRAQRLYVEEWVHVVGAMHPGLSDAEIRAVVHGVLSMLQSPSEFVSGLPTDTLVNLLSSMALAALRGAQTRPVDRSSTRSRTRRADKTA
jgi:AcrR family transcriptional regulator